MIKNYFAIAIRSISRHKSFSILNVLGLSIGMISFLVILLYIQYELSFDKHIHNLENKYRVVEIQTEPGVGEQHVAVTMGPLGEALQREFPEVNNYVRLLRGYGLTVNYKNKSFNENWFAFADSTIFDMFNVNLILGDKKTALQEMNSIVLSENVAKKYFDSPENAMDKIIEIYGESFIVHGVMEDYSRKSSVYFNALIPFKILQHFTSSYDSWGSNSFDTYIELKDGVDRDALEAKFPDFTEKYMADHWRNVPGLYLQPIEDMHLKSKHIKFQVYNHRQSDINQVYMFSVIALLILIVACINYINLATSLALRRYKEVGIRKVAGASKPKLILQFLGESMVITIIAAILALGGISLFLPVVNQILGIDLTMDFGNLVFTLGLLGTILIAGFLSGIYPALYMSGFKPAAIFSGFRSTSGKTSSGVLRKVLVVTQFSVSIVIIIATIIALSQVHYFQKKDKGYNDEAVYSIPVRIPDGERMDKIRLFMNELKNNPNIAGISASSSPTGVSGSQGGIYLTDSAETKLMVRFGYIDPNYLPLMNIKIMEGRNFSEDRETDRYHTIILNEIAAKKLGLKNPVGTQFLPRGGDSINATVIGVIKDYNYYSLHSPVEPAAYYYNPHSFEYVNVKLNTANLNETVKEIEKKWISLFPSVPFNGYFMDQQYELNYAKEINTTRIFGIFAMLCIFISCLGLFGLVSFVVNQKTKEIAVRKVFGSNVRQVIAVISKEFIMLVIIASLIGIPIAWYYMGQWLNNFAYKISLSWYYFAFAVIAAVIIAFLTIIYKAASAANTNPATALRDE